MSTFTPRLQLEKPAPGDLMRAVPALEDSYEDIDLVAGAPSYTSGTRPGTPYQGRIIFETDTGNLLHWNGSKWAYWGNNEVGRDLVHIDTDANGATNTTETLFRSHTFNATQNRRYRIDFCTFGENASNVSSRYRCNIRWAVGGTVTTAGTLISGTAIKLNSVGVCGRSMRDFTELNYTSASQQITIGWFNEDLDGNSCGFGNTTDAMDVASSFMIRDWGAS